MLTPYVPYLIRRLTVRQLLTELHDGGQGEAPGRQAWLATRGEEGGKVLILENRAERVTEREIGAPVGKAARATRTVSSGTGWMTWGLSDMTSPPRAPSGLDNLCTPDYTSTI